MVMYGTAVFTNDLWLFICQHLMTVALSSVVMCRKEKEVQPSSDKPTKA